MGPLIFCTFCTSLRKSFRKPQDSQSTQHRKAFIGIDQVAELVEIPFITKFSSITRPISETFLPLQPSLKAFQYFRIFFAKSHPKVFMHANSLFKLETSSLEGLPNHFKTSSCGSSSLKSRDVMLHSSLVVFIFSKISSLVWR